MELVNPVTAVKNHSNLTLPAELYHATCERHLSSLAGFISSPMDYKMWLMTVISIYCLLCTNSMLGAKNKMKTIPAVERGEGKK